MPVPSAVISVPICSELNILSKRARSTLRILPRSGSTAWNSRLRPILALPPALSPSTMNISDLAGSFSWQRGHVERTLAPRQLARFSRSLAGGRGLHHLADNDFGLGGVFLEPCRQ